MKKTNTSQPDTLQRGLKERHIQLMALGACLGAGLFLGSAKAISLAGPAILAAYALGGSIMFIIMRALGELAVDKSVAGSFSYYANKYIGPLAGYLTGWNYWFMCVVVSVTEITAVAIYMGMWFPDIPRWYWSLGALLTIGSVNMMAVKFFGEIEVWSAIIKIATVLLLIIGGLGTIIFGLANQGVGLGLDNLWKHNGFVPKGWINVTLAMPLVMFAFLGTEMLGITAGETQSPKKLIPRAISSVLWRILFFYVGAMFVVLAIHPWNELDIHQSPFISVFEKLGIRTATGIVNFVIIIAALSTCNGSVYASARMLYSLSKQNHAPRILGVTAQNGVPRRALSVCLVMMAIGVLLNYLVPDRIFMWLAAISTFSAVWTWAIILLAQLIFRWKLSRSERKSLLYPMPLWPISGIIALCFLMFLLVIMAILPETRLALFIGPSFILFLAMTYRWQKNNVD